MYLLSKYGENGGGSVTGLEADSERMCERILFCAFSVRVQGIIEYKLKIGGRGRGGRRLRMRHECESRGCQWLGRGWFTASGHSLPRVSCEFSWERMMCIDDRQDDRRSKDNA